MKIYIESCAYVNHRAIQKGDRFLFPGDDFPDCKFLAAEDLKDDEVTAVQLPDGILVDIVFYEKTVKMTYGIGQRK